MKKQIILLTTLAVLFTSAAAFAKGGGKGRGQGDAEKGTEQKEKVIQKAESEDKGKQIEKQKKEDSEQELKDEKEKLEKEKEKAIQKAESEDKGEQVEKQKKEDNEQELKDEKEKLEKEKEKSKEASEGKSDENIGRGREHKQQIEAMNKQTVREQAKHNERVARLNRIREIAAQEGDTKTVERVDKLIAGEEQRYQKKMKRMSGKEEKIGSIQEKTKEQKETKVKSKDSNSTVLSEPNNK